MSGKKPFFIGITGTNGKSTCASLIAHLLDVPVFGNIGRPLLDVLGQDILYVVVELSSYQLELSSVFKANIAVLLSLFSDHMPRHRTMAHYKAQKSRLMLAQDETCSCFYFRDDSTVQSLLSLSAARLSPVGSDLFDGFSHSLLGAHNHDLVCMGVRIAQSCGIDDSLIRARLKTFSPLPHRLSMLGLKQGRYWINDSKSTNLLSTQAAVEACSRPPILILCGEDKGFDLRAFILFVQARVKKALVFGDLIHCFQLHRSLLSSDQWVFLSDLESVFSCVMSVSEEGDWVLFSPSSSSYDQFNGFEDRGNRFEAKVASL